MRNIAICLRGDFRTWNIIKDAYSTYIDHSKYNVHYFYTSWDRQQLIPYLSDPQDSDFFEVSDQYVIDQFANISGTLTSFKILPKPEYRINTFVAQAYLIYECNKLKRQYEYDNNMNFDYVIISRPDAIIDLTEIFNTEQRYYDCRLHTDYWLHSGLTRSDIVFGGLYQPDFVFVGSSLSIDVFSNCFVEMILDYNKSYFSTPLGNHGAIGDYMLRRKLVNDGTISTSLEGSLVREGIDIDSFNKCETLIEKINIAAQYSQIWWDNMLSRVFK